MQKGRFIMIKFLVANKNAYFYSLEKDCVQPFKWTYKNIFIKNICQIMKWALPRFCLNKDLFNADRIVITDSIFSCSLLKSLEKKYDINNIYLYYMNVIDSKNIQFMKYIKKENIYSFDKTDSNKYSIKYLHTPYSGKVKVENCKIEYDTVFLGREKGRSEEIEIIYNMLDTRNLRSKFMVLGSDNDNFKISKLVDYSTYIKLINKSKSILEINLKNQDGCTLRFVESLFLYKKLITNNMAIVEDKYYNPNNVFIIGQDDENSLVDFLNTPFEKVHGIRNIDFQFWLRNFGLEDK